MHKALFCSQCQIKADVYLLYVRLILEYAAAVWVPHNKCYIERLEVMQRSATSFAVSNYVYNHNSGVTLIGLATLCDRRKVAGLCLLYKILHNLVDNLTFPCQVTSHQQQELQEDIIKIFIYPNLEVMDISLVLSELN